MNEWRALLYKEWRECLRTYKLLILGLGFLFFAILDPVMLKLLPEFMKTQLEGLDLSAVMRIDQTAAVLNFQQSLYQMGSLIAALTLMNLIPNEYKTGTHIIPLTNGCSQSGFILFRFFFYALLLTALSILAVMVNYFYAVTLFEGSPVMFAAAVRGGLFFGLYFLFLLGLLLFWGIVFRNGPAAAVLTLLLLFLMPTLFRIIGIPTGHPGYLIGMAEQLEASDPENSGITIVITLVAASGLLALSRLLVGRRDLYQR